MIEERKDSTTSRKYKNIPILNIKVMTDDEWNRLAYRLYLQRAGEANVGA